MIITVLLLKRFCLLRCPIRAFQLLAVKMDQMRGANSLNVRALVFDVFGAVVDWRGSIIREGEQWDRALSVQVDWAHFADRWRAGYDPSMQKVRSGALPWMKLDDLHELILDELLEEFQIRGLLPEESTTGIVSGRGWGRGPTP